MANKNEHSRATTGHPSETEMQADDAASKVTGPGTAVSTYIDDRPVTTGKSGMRFRMTNQITIPPYMWIDENPLYCKIVDAVYTAKHIKMKDGKPEQEPADAMNILDLESGSGIKLQAICNAVLKKNLDETFPNNGYVGKCFMIVRHAKGKGKQYYGWSLAEIEPVEGDGSDADKADTETGEVLPAGSTEGDAAKATA